MTTSDGGGTSAANCSATASEDSVRGERVARMLLPHEQDYFILKPKHSAFYATPLELLLQHLGTRTLIIASFVSDTYVLDGC